ncbi:MAG: hypothetical protein ACKOFF_07135 [Acidimicrobiales bacterium]
MEELPTDTEDLLIDRIDSLRILRAASDEERDRLLLQIGGPDRVEQEMARELASTRVLAHPSRFEEAHCVLMRGIEVLHRNGSRPPRGHNLRFLSVVPRWVTHQVIQFIVRSHVQSLTRTIGRLYEQREASCPWGTAEHSLLRRCRIDMHRVRDGLESRAIGLPAFIFGGAVLTTVGSGLQAVLQFARGSVPGIIVAGAVLMGVLIGLSWVALHSAAVARRRIKLAVEQPLGALWETIGDAGNPPRDDSFNFAVYAIILLVLAWIIVPFAFWLAVSSA